MVYSKAKTVSEYLAELEPKRQAEIEKLRQLLLSSLPAGLEEAMNWGMICYQVPLSLVPKTYNNQPLLYAAIASQKNYISLYLMPIYAFDQARAQFESAWLATGKKLDVGKSCVRFKNLDEIPLQVVSKAAGQISLAEYVKRYELIQARKSAK